MRIYRNTAYVKKKKKIARAASLFGFLLLGSTFFLAFQPKYMVIAYAILFTGFIIFNFGMQQLGLWSRRPRNDEAIDYVLGGLPEAKYTMIHFSRAGKRVIGHLLVHPGGLLAIITRELPGKVTYNGKRWRKTGVGVTRFFSMSGPQLGNPTMDVDADVAALEAFFREKNIAVDIYPAIVFLNDRAELDIDDSVEMPIMMADVLPAFVRELEPDAAFSNADRDALIALLTSEPGFEKPVVRPTRRPVKVKARSKPAAKPKGDAA
jgi:hypothetical protein